MPVKPYLGPSNVPNAECSIQPRPVLTQPTTMTRVSDVDEHPTKDPAIHCAFVFSFSDSCGSQTVTARKCLVGSLAHLICLPHGEIGFVDKSGPRQAFARVCERYIYIHMIVADKTRPSLWTAWLKVGATTGRGRHNTFPTSRGILGCQDDPYCMSFSTSHRHALFPPPWKLLTLITGQLPLHLKYGHPTAPPRTPRHPTTM